MWWPFRSSRQPIRTRAVTTSLHRLTPVLSPQPLMFYGVRKPAEHAAKLVEQIRAVGACAGAPSTKATSRNSIAPYATRWGGIGVSDLPSTESLRSCGVRKDQVCHDGRRLTTYEISLATEAVVDLAAARRRA